MEMKVKQIQKFKISKDMNAYLIRRYYRKDMVTEYIACLNYDFKHNVYIDGVVLRRLNQAYQLFNYLCRHGNFPSDQEVKHDNMVLD